MSKVQNKILDVVGDGLATAELKSALAGRRFHFIGAGGVGMSGLAQLLLQNKATVTGSDAMDSTVTEKLNESGAAIHIGHDKANIDTNTEVVVISAAIKEDNPELTEARSRGLKVYKYAEMLGELMGGYDGIAVSGTHGKSTTSGWLVYCLKQAGVDVNYIVGAGINQLNASSGVGRSTYFAAEACEYDRSFLNLKPLIGCILNIEQDHLDYYKDEREIVRTFVEFANGVKKGGVIIANGEDANVAKVLSSLPGKVNCETFGLDKRCNFSARNIQLADGLCSFEVYHDGKLLGPTRISLAGAHNILNALAVAAIMLKTGVQSERILESLPHFTGIERRMEFKGVFAGITVIDDYAHHPTEIKASLKAIRLRYKPKRLWCVFQPHQYSRTRFLLDDFAESFKLADVTVVPEIYFVRDTEQSKRQVNSEILVERIRQKGCEAIFVDSFEGICEYLKGNVSCGDVMVTMGAGNIWKVADGYIQWLRENS